MIDHETTHAEMECRRMLERYQQTLRDEEQAHQAVLAARKAWQIASEIVLSKRRFP